MSKYKDRTIVICSNESDVSTDDVISWINYYGCKKDKISIIRNNSSLINLLYLTKFKCSQHIIWLRKNSRSNQSNLNPYVKLERRKIEEFIHNYMILEYKHHGDLMADENRNKYFDLILANKCSFKVPISHLISNTIELSQLLNTPISWITKSIFNQSKFELDGKIYWGGYPSLVRKEYFINSPSFIQEYVKKAFEIRVFVFDNTIYSMAIFSQNNEKTKIDYRNYDIEKPNRCIPFKLPKIVENQISKLLSSTLLNTASIDLIYSIDGDFYFIDLNPTGQFGWLSSNCNYYIEEFIAKRLIYGKPK